MVLVRYSQSFGKCDGGEVVDLDIDLTLDEQKVYDAEIERIKNEILENDPELSLDEIELTDDDVECLNQLPELSEALQRAAIEAMECEASEYCNEEFVEALGLNEMDAYEIEELVKKRDPYTLKYFNLESVTNEELEEWTADELDEIPMVCEFKNFRESFR